MNGLRQVSMFIPDGYTKTWAEMTKDEQNDSSMRRPALKKLEGFLKNMGAHGDEA